MDKGEDGGSCPPLFVRFPTRLPLIPCTLTRKPHDKPQDKPQETSPGPVKRQAFIHGGGIKSTLGFIPHCQAAGGTRTGKPREKTNRRGQSESEPAKNLSI